MPCYTVPIVSFNDCLPLINLSEIQYAYIANEDAVNFSDWRNVTEWNQRISNDGTIPDGSPFETNDLIRKLNVIADMPLTSPTIKQISLNRNAEVRTPRSINIDIDETTVENYDLIRSTETILGARVKMWFKTAAGVRWGGNAGITGYLKLRPVLGRGSDSIELYTGTFTWDSLKSPDRYFDAASASEVGAETGSIDGSNQKERIEFGTEPTLALDWTTLREQKFGAFPGVCQVWQYSGDGADKIDIQTFADESGPISQLIFYLPGVPGYIIIE